MRKTLKFQIMLVTLLVIVYLFFPHIVMATSTDKTEIAEKIINLIPDTLKLDINEIEYEKAQDEIERSIADICKDNGINIDDLAKQGLKINIDTSLLYSVESSHEARIGIKDNETSLVEKTIKLSYKNQANYNTEDEQYVKSLELSMPKYFEISLENSRIKWSSKINR